MRIAALIGADSGSVIIGHSPTCGRALDVHDRHLRFALPDPVLETPAREKTPGT